MSLNATPQCSSRQNHVSSSCYLGAMLGNGTPRDSEYQMPLRSNTTSSKLVQAKQGDSKHSSLFPFPFLAAFVPQVQIQSARAPSDGASSNLEECIRFLGHCAIFTPVRKQVSVSIEVAKSGSDFVHP
jgi:hypothetical protein